MALRICQGCHLSLLRAYCNAPPIAVCIDDERVKTYLSQLTGMDFDKIFKERKEELTLPQYQLLTEAQLRMAHEESVKDAQKLLTAPPIVPERTERGQEIETDPQLDRYDDAKWVFTDISMGVDDKERYIVVREPTGTLREATWEERDRLCQLYFPKPGRKLWLPKLLTEDHLPSVLERGYYIHALDCVCAQCQPDSPDYIRVHHSVYKHIDRCQLYSELYSTRYYSGLVWHLLKQDSLEGILTYTMTAQRLDDVETLIQLYLLMKPEHLNNLPSPCPTGLELIQVFCEYKNYTTVLKLVSDAQTEPVELTN